VVRWMTDTYTAIATRSAEVLGNFHEGLEMAIAGLLQSPNFLFRVEVGEPTPEGGRRYTSLEMASRLSFALWHSIPDEALLAAGERGELATEEGVREAAWRLLDSPRASTAVRAFFSEMLRLEALDRLPQYATDFPFRTETIGASMREGTLLTIQHQLWERDGGYRSLFDSPTTFVDQDLAALYGVPAPTGPGFAQVCAASAVVARRRGTWRTRGRGGHRSVVAAAGPKPQQGGGDHGRKPHRGLLGKAHGVTRGSMGNRCC